MMHLTSRYNQCQINQTLADLSDGTDALRHANKPKGALLQVNSFCNLQCSHCSISAPRIQRGVNLNELSLEEWIEILSRLKSIGITRVRFTGGEPFLRSDLEQLCRKSQEFCFEVSFVTNGLLILPNNIKWLKEIQPQSIWVSVYGFPASIYESVSGARGAFSRLTKTVERLISAQIDVGLYYPVGDVNYREIGGFIRYFYSLGIRLIKVMQVLGHGRAAAPGGLCPFSVDDLESTLDRIIETVIDCPGITVKVSIKAGQSELFRSKGFQLPEDRSCQIGLQNLWTIDSNGSVSPCCLFLNKGKLDLFNASSHEEFSKWRLWNRSNVLTLLELRNKTVRSCPAISEIDGSEQNSIDDFVCPLSYAKATS